MSKELTRGERVIAFIERYCKAPEGALVGQPVKLEPFQKKFILDVYDNPHGTRRAFLSMARKNGKTALIAAILLAHVCGPEAVQNSQIISGALSREQAAIVFNLAKKMVELSPEMMARVRIVPSSKKLYGLSKNVEFHALAAEGKTAHGLSPILAVIDEVGQVKGPQSDFIDAITTSQGAHIAPLLIAISTQAPGDNDLFSIWIDDAVSSKDPRIVCHIYAASKEANLDDEKAWSDANPALGSFRSLEDVKEQSERAKRMPSFEPTFRNLVLNQRVEMAAPFISRGVWILNSHDPDESVFYEEPVFIGVDLSGKTDLTSAVAIAWREKWHVKAFFWTPEKGLRERSKRDRAPYDVWASQGHIRTIEGASIDYEHIAKDLSEFLHDVKVSGIAFDRWRFDLLVKEFAEVGLADLPLLPFGQGFRDMSPAVEALETALLNEEVAHGGNPVLTMCMSNSRIEKDPAGNRKLSKIKSTGRIDGAVALTMAMGISTKHMEDSSNLENFINAPLRIKY